jgi:UDP-N-acetylmuramoyl-tripeptide--D-alanyl-D-alanine ligase
VTTIVATVVLTAGMVAAATHGRVAAGSVDQRFDGVSIDSRTIARGGLFVAIRGERFDGHAFIEAALARGASGLVVSEAPPYVNGIPVIVVPDTLAALQQLGREVRRQSRARVIAITGSAGKTTTKEVTAELLASRYQVFRNQGNLNNHIGLPLSLIELRHGPEIAVVELGMNHAGEIRQLVGIAEPDVRVWINVGDAHLGFFGSRGAIAQAKAEILESATADAILVANADDPLVMSHVRGFAGRVVTYGEAPGADVRASNVIDRGFDGTRADVDSTAGRLSLAVPLPGRPHLSNVLAAVAVAVLHDVPRDAIESRVARLGPVHRRGAGTMLPSGVRLIDDSYNASPAAVQAMLAALASTPASGRRIAVLGEMLELGDSSRSLHAECGRTAATAGVDELIVIGGPDADGMAEGALAAGLDASHIHRFDDSASAAPAVAGLVKAGDLVLVKGSRGTRTDLVADRLREVA